MIPTGGDHGVRRLYAGVFDTATKLIPFAILFCDSVIILQHSLFRATGSEPAFGIIKETLPLKNTARLSTIPSLGEKSRGMRDFRIT